MPTLFELRYLVLEPFLLPLYPLVRRQILRHLPRQVPPPALLDVGGRKSHTTIGVPAQITITDVQRASPLQHKLHLGVNEQIFDQIRGRRSNIRTMLFDDMTRSALPTDAFDFVLAVEVLEHVEEDDLFVSHVARVLRPAGTFFMTTPNGDFVPNTNPDHKRHYRRDDLEKILKRHFAEVDVWYAVADSPWRKKGLQSWSPKRPIRTMASMAANFVDGIRSRSPRWRSRASGTRHLFALCRGPLPA